MSKFSDVAQLLQQNCPITPALNLISQGLIPRRENELVVIRGAGDIASGVALRLVRCGYRVVMLEIAQPTAIRRSAAFAQAVFDGSFTVEDLTARLVVTAQEALDLTQRGEIALLVDPQAQSLAALAPNYLVDAILAKENLGTHKRMAPITIALGPGFSAGNDCDAVIETNRGHRLGRVILSGGAEANTGIPGEIAGKSDLRVVRAPCAGVFRSCVALGDLIVQGALMGQVGDTTVTAPLTGMVRGLLQDGLQVTTRFKIGDIDPRGAKADHLSASDKALAIGGGVLEAMLRLQNKALASSVQLT
jgi:xanthine dehydrogenase accessory factor